MACIDQSITVGPTNVTVYSQECDGGANSNAIYDLGDYGSLISVQLGDRNFDQRTIEYALDRYGNFQPVYATRAAPQTSNATITHSQKAAKMQRALARPVLTTIYMGLKGECDANISQLIVVPKMRPSSIKGGTFANYRGTPAEFQRSVDYVMDNFWYPIGITGFASNMYAGLAGGTAPTTAGTGIVFAPQNVNCGGNCPDPVGTHYQVFKKDGTSPYALYRVKNGAFVRSNITVMVAGDDVVGKAVIAGNYLVVAFNGTTVSGYYYAPINTNGSLGTWVRIATGFPTATTLAGVTYQQGILYFAGADTANQYIVSTVGAGATTIGNSATNAMLDVVGCGNTVLYGGANMSMLIVTDRGNSVRQPVFTVPFGAPAVAGGTNITACHMFDSNTFEIATSIGRGFRTLDGGVSWVEIPYNTGSATSITDLVYSDDGQVGYLSQGANLFKSVTGGFGGGSASIGGWSATGFISNYSTGLGTIAAIALPVGADQFTAANYVAVSAGTGGAAVLGSPTYA
jgi:hypothetical protein